MASIGLSISDEMDINTLFLLYTASFNSCIGFRNVFIPASTVATITVMISTKVTMYLVVLRTFQSFFHVTFYDIMVDQRCKSIQEQNSQHPSFRVSGIDNPDDHTDHTDQKSVHQFPEIGPGCGHRIGGHKYDGKPKTTHYKLLLPWNRHKWSGTPQVKQHGHDDSSH